MKQPTLHNAGIPVYGKAAIPVHHIGYTIPAYACRKMKMIKLLLPLLLFLTGSLFFPNNSRAQDYRLP